MSNHTSCKYEHSVKSEFQCLAMMCDVSYDCTLVKIHASVYGHDDDNSHSVFNIDDGEG